MYSVGSFFVKSEGIRNISWDRKREIGQGSFGTTVYHGNFNNVKVAVKRVQKMGFVIVGQKFIQDFLPPRSRSHPNVIEYFALESDRDFWFDP